MGGGLGGGELGGGFGEGEGALHAVKGFSIECDCVEPLFSQSVFVVGVCSVVVHFVHVSYSILLLVSGSVRPSPSAKPLPVGSVHDMQAMETFLRHHDVPVPFIECALLLRQAHPRVAGVCSYARLRVLLDLHAPFSCILRKV
eukprot:5310224-Pleurochrysis_carterae.AAC.1